MSKTIITSFASSSLTLVSLLWLLLSVSANPLTTTTTTNTTTSSSSISSPINELSLQLLSSSDTTTTTTENTVFSSPLIFSSLLALMNGALKGGDTERALNNVMNLNLNNESNVIEALNREMSALLDTFGEHLPQIMNTLLVNTNSDDNKALNETFAKSVHSFCDVIAVNLKANATNVTKEVNACAERKVETKLFRDILDENSGLVVANAVHFRPLWKTPFDPKLTAKGIFYNTMSAGLPPMPSSVDFMNGVQSVRVKSVPELSNAQLIEVPLKTKDSQSSHHWSLIVVMSDKSESDSIDSLTENVTQHSLRSLSAHIDDLMTTIEPKNISIAFPKFKLESDIDLKEMFDELDAKHVFDESADFTAITANKARVTTALHKCVMDVEEEVEGVEVEGVEGGSGNTATATPTSGQMALKVDKPFIFVVRDARTDVFVVMGRVQTLVDEELLSLGFI